MIQQVIVKKRIQTMNNKFIKVNSVNFRIDNITVDDMLSSTRKSINIKFGIDGYKVPPNCALLSYPKYSFPKEKNRSGPSIEEKIKAANPSPDHYNHKLSWNTPSGKILPGKKYGFLDPIFEKEKLKPGPNSYTPNDFRFKREPSWKLGFI